MAEQKTNISKPRSISYSAINDHTYLLMPSDLNHNNTAFGGRIMEIADRVAGTVAMRHSNATCATLLVDSMKFLAPAVQGDLLVFKASLNRVWGSSMEIGIKVYAENTKTDEKKHILSAYFTFVALDENKKSKQIRPVAPKTKEEKRRYKEANKRREQRLKNKK